MIIIGCDHAGYDMKEKIKEMLEKQKYSYTDVSKDFAESDDYTDVVTNICEKMCKEDKAIMVCGTGIGSSIMANKFVGIRAAICYDEYTAKMTRYHNDANMLSLGERVLGRGLALEIVEAWISTEFEGDRHSKRVDMIKEIENKHFK